VWATAVGYAGGYTPNPTYEAVCSGRTGHVEVLLVVFDPDQIISAQLLEVFWEGPRPHAGDAPRQRRRDAVPLRHHNADEAQWQAGEVSRATF
jgi:peptide-methionine (S)-S-oxide reductase